MPEGHTVHRLALAFAELFGGQRLAATSPQGRFADGAALLDGQWLVGTEAHGKHLFLAFGRAADVPVEDGPVRWLRVHLGLYGSWTFAGDRSFHGPHAIGAPRRRVAEEEVALPAVAGTDGAGEGADGVGEARDGAWEAPAPRGAVRVRLLGEHGVADLTGPTACEVITAAEKDAVHARLGPDPLRPDDDPEAFVRAVRSRRRAVGELLMDQAVIAGVGNIYRAEALYRARLHPTRRGETVPAARLRRTWDDLRALMGEGVATGRIVTTSPQDHEVTGEPWYVYRRSGAPCLVCGTRIAESTMAGRRVFWCPRCQRAR